MKRLMSLMLINKPDNALPFEVPGWVNWVAQDGSGMWWGYWETLFAE
jgi:hypothetical protein